MAEDTVALLEQLERHAARSSSGWSDGANLALDIGMHHPDKVVTRIVASSGNFEPRAAPIPAAAKLFFHGIKPDNPLMNTPPRARAYARESPDGVGPLRRCVFERLRKMWQTDPRWTAEGPRDHQGADVDHGRATTTRSCTAAHRGDGRGDPGERSRPSCRTPITTCRSPTLRAGTRSSQTFLDEPPRKPMQ